MSTTREATRRSNEDVARTMLITGIVVFGIAVVLLIFDTPIADLVLNVSGMVQNFGISTWMFLVNFLLVVGALLVVCSIVVRRLPDSDRAHGDETATHVPPGEAVARRRDNREVARTMLVFGAVVVGMGFASSLMSGSMYEFSWYLPFGLGGIISRSINVLSGIGYPLGSFLIVGSIIVGRLPEATPPVSPPAT